jgi:hypothetical protein
VNERVDQIFHTAKRVVQRGALAGALALTPMAADFVSYNPTPVASADGGGFERDPYADFYKNVEVADQDIKDVSNLYQEYFNPNVLPILLDEDQIRSRAFKRLISTSFTEDYRALPIYDPNYFVVEIRSEDGSEIVAHLYTDKRDKNHTSLTIVGDANALSALLDVEQMRAKAKADFKDLSNQTGEEMLAMGGQGGQGTTTMISYKSTDASGKEIVREVGLSGGLSVYVTAP